MKSHTQSRLIDRIYATLRDYYPVGLDADDPAYQLTSEFQRLQELRKDSNLLQQSCSMFIKALEERFDHVQLQDETDVDLYPSYHVRLLGFPKASWPKKTWNWDVDFVKTWKQVGWLDIFCSYLGPFFTAVGVELQCVPGQLTYRYVPPMTSAGLRAEFYTLRKAMEDTGRKFVGGVIAARVISEMSDEIHSLGNATVFSLLFDDTYPAATSWDGHWRLLDEGIRDLRLPNEEPTVGQLILEATLRNELGTIRFDC